MKSLIAALSFFTRIPFRPKFEIDGDIFARGIKCLPLVAFVVGAPVGALFALQLWLGPGIAALLALAAYVLLTGGLHIDGFADTLDGMGSRRDRETTLAIMKDSHIGTFGALGVGLYVAAMLVCMAHADWRFAGLFALAGRTAALLCGRMFPYARESGAGKGFMSSVRWGHVLLSAAAYLALAALLCADFAAVAFSFKQRIVLCAPFAAALVAVPLVTAGISRRLGGVTGDVIGFDVELAQLVYLLCGCVMLRVW